MGRFEEYRDFRKFTESQNEHQQQLLVFPSVGAVGCKAASTCRLSISHFLLVCFVVLVHTSLSAFVALALQLFAVKIGFAPFYFSFS